MTKEEATEAAIDRIIGQDVIPGTMIASREDPLIWKFLRYQGKFAFCEGGDGVVTPFPRSSIFDVKKVVNVANHLLNVGFWEEGMESMILNVSRADSSPSDPELASSPVSDEKTLHSGSEPRSGGIL